MFKFRITFGIITALIILGCRLPVNVAMFAGGAVELLAGVYLLISLLYTDTFDIETIAGKIISQMTIYESIGIDAIVLIVGVRLVAFIVAAYGLWFVGVPLYLLTAIHYDKKAES